jgi:hypothetical protein
MLLDASGFASMLDLDGYSYGYGRPFSFRDPSGLQPVADWAEDRLGWGCFGSPCGKVRQAARDSAEYNRAYPSEVAEFVLTAPRSKIMFFLRMCDSGECHRRRYEEEHRAENAPEPPDFIVLDRGGPGGRKNSNFRNRNWKSKRPHFP